MPKLKAIPSRLYRSFSPALVGAVAFAFATTALADPSGTRLAKLWVRPARRCRMASTGSRFRAPTLRRRSTGSS